MKKEQIVKTMKVIQFPGLEKRLLEKGLENLQAKNYREAANLFQQCIDLDPENQDSYIGLLLAYFDSGMVEQAITLAHFMLQEGIGNEMETLDIYLMLLVQRNQHEKVVEEIQLLLKENRIPYHKLEHFERLLHLSENMLENKLEMANTDSEEIQLESLNLYEYQGPQEQIMIAAQLNQQPVRQYEEEIKEYLQSKKGDSFFKTLILNVLKEQQYDYPVDIEKFGRRMTIIPNKMVNLSENAQLLALIEAVSSVLEDEDPTLYENIKTLIERHFFIIYPLPLEDLSIEAWGAAYHFTGNEYYGIHHSIDKMSEIYNVTYEEVEKALQFIKEIEELL